MKVRAARAGLVPAGSASADSDGTIKSCECDVSWLIRPCYKPCTAE